MSKSKKDTVPFMARNDLKKAIAKNAAIPSKDLGSITFDCKQADQKIVMKITGKGRQIVTDMDFVPPLGDEEVPMTPVLQIFSLLMKQLQGLK